MLNTPRRPSPKALALCALALLLALAGAAWAAIPGPEGIIHGCYNSHSGALRVINTAAHAKCTHREHELNWSETGPPGKRGGGGAKGATGPRGSAGTLGPTGPHGTTEALASAQTGELELLSSAHTLASVGVSPGKYIIEADVTIAQGHAPSEAGEASCLVRAAPTPAAEARASATLPAVEGAAQTIPLDGAFTVSAADTLELSCSKSSGSLSASQAQLDAIQVDAINGS